jgi:predicted GH43/DUF377 family glycosyl hydrolase
MMTKIIFKTIVLIGLLSSTSLKAQIAWTKNAANPVLRRDTVIANFPNDIIAISDCWVAKEGVAYKMWYTCGGFNYPTDTLLRSRLCYATSSDGIHWTKYSGNPVLDVSYTGGWDSLGVETATVLIDSIAPVTERYKMWYAGQYFNSYRYDIGYAFSSNGINWTKYPVPVLQVGIPAQWDNGFLEGPSILKDGSTYKMWYCGYDAVVDANGTDGHANIGYATSTDGIHWTKYIGNPILTTGNNTWDSINVQDPHVIKQGSKYYMWYGGGASYTNYDQQVGFAYSSDGISWTKSTVDPVLKKGVTGKWDAQTASFPSVLYDSGAFKMWYTGKDADPLPVGSLNYYWEIGYATAIMDTNNINNSFINVFPNPAKNKLYIQTSFDLNNAELKIYNLLGQIVKSISNINSRNISIESFNLSTGTYFIVLQSGNKKFSSKFIIVK